MTSKQKNFRGETLEQARQQVITALRASKTWMGGYAEAYVDDFELMAHDRLREVLLGIDEQSTDKTDAVDAARYRFLKSAGIIRVFPMASGMMSRGGSRIWADTKEWLEGDFSYVIDGKTVDVDTAIDAAIASATGDAA